MNGSRSKSVCQLDSGPLQRPVGQNSSADWNEGLTVGPGITAQGQVPELLEVTDRAYVCLGVKGMERIQRRETGTGVSSEHNTASPGFSQALWEDLENFPSKYFYWGPLRQKS